jgi:acyl-CoA thioesterase
VTEWILLDAHVQHVGDGLGYGVAHLWSEAGTLLGTASQTLVLRQLQADGLTARSNRRIV